MQKRQGNLLFEKTNYIPSDCVEVKRTIIEYGEATGHIHSVSNPNQVKLMTPPSSQQVDYIRVLQPTKIIHDTHQPLILPKGNWVVIRQVSLELRERRIIHYVRD